MPPVDSILTSGKFIKMDILIELPSYIQKKILRGSGKSLLNFFLQIFEFANKLVIK